MPAPPCDDVALLRKIADGDQDAMSEFYRLHSQAVRSHRCLVVDDPALAEEVFQDAMLAVWRSANSFRGESRVRTWVIAIARRQARNRLRRREPGAPASSAATPDRVSPWSASGR